MSQIICVSRGSLTRGKELAEALAHKLGYPVLSREDLIEAAIKEGIQVSKLETSMMKPHAFTERLARERDHYLAFSTAYLCDRLAEGSLVYHGRTGHLLLRDLGHVLRVRVVADEEYRVQSTMARLGIPREKAVRYLAEIEEDRRNWVRSMYGVSWEDASQYDVIVNVERMAVENTAAALVGMAQLLDFQMTPASQRAMENLRLTAKARLALARDPRTASAGFTVGVHDGVVTVTYLPHDMEFAEDVPRVLEGLEEARHIRATMASTTILWVQEAFDPTSETFRDVVEIAGKWNAAVELVRYVPDDGDGSAPLPAAYATPSPARVPVEAGIEDDVDETPTEDGGLKITLDELALLGLAGGGHFLQGERGNLVAKCCGTVARSLVVVGNLFLRKDAAARVRLTREMREAIAERMRVPVVTIEELRSQYLFSPRDMIPLVGFLLLAVILYILVFTNQLTVLQFLLGSWKGAGKLAPYVVAVAVFAFVPLVAWVYGRVARSVMKLIKME